MICHWIIVFMFMIMSKWNLILHTLVWTHAICNMHFLYLFPPIYGLHVIQQYEMDLSHNF